MLPFKLIYSDGYYLPIGEHVFPAEKYRRIRDRLLAEGVAEASDFLEPEPATDEDILLVHKPEYVFKLVTGTLSPRRRWRWKSPTRAIWWSRSGWPPGDRFWRRGRLWPTASASALAADFIMPSPTTARVSA